MRTAQQAADVVNISRPFLISLLDKGLIPHDTVGRHRRIKAADLFTYERSRDKTHRDALSGLAALDGELL
ncbi:MAG: excisionase family DNA-binding protein [Bradyrhizobium sp.]